MSSHSELVPEQMSSHSELVPEQKIYQLDLNVAFNLNTSNPLSLENVSLFCAHALQQIMKKNSLPDQITRNNGLNIYGICQDEVKDSFLVFKSLKTTLEILITVTITVPD